jgi:hypothetical protein
MHTPNNIEQRNTFLTICRTLTQLNDNMAELAPDSDMFAAYKTAWDQTEQGLKTILTAWGSPVFDDFLSDHVLAAVQSGSLHAVNAVAIPEQKFSTQDLRDGFMLHVGPKYVEQVFNRVRLQGKLLAKVLDKAQTNPEWRPLLDHLIRIPMTTQNSSDFFYEISYAQKPRQALNGFRDILPQVLRALFQVSPNIPQLLLEMFVKHNIDMVKDHLCITASTGGRVDFSEKRLEPLWENFTHHQIMNAYTPSKELETASHRGLMISENA